MKKTIIAVLLCQIFFLFQGHAQTAKADAEDYKDILSRPLLVQVLEEDPRIIKSLEKKIAKDPDVLTSYKNRIAAYNANLKRAVDMLWKLNSSIEYKTTSELEALRKDKSSKYVVLFYTETTKSYEDAFGNNIYLTEEAIPTLNYSRLEKSIYKVDYSCYMPLSMLRKDKCFNLSDMIFTVQFMQNNINYIRNTKKEDAKSFAKIQAKEHCADLKNKTILIDEEMVDEKVNSAEIKQFYSKPFKITSAAAIDEIVMPKGSNTPNVKYAYAVTIAYDIVGGSANRSIGAAKVGIAMHRQSCMRVIVDLATGNILAMEGVNFGERNTPYFVAKDFKHFAECDK